MSKEIVNRVANSQLVSIDLEDFYPEGERVLFDIKDWLFAEQILKENDFRESVKNHNWQSYQNKYIALTCSADAIIPSWAYLLISVALLPFAKKIVIGNLNTLETSIFQDIINGLPVENYINKRVIIKGCSNKPIPETAYTQLIARLLPFVRSIMYGEACSNVPLFKKS
ncbi:MAG: DUF2480 family protein [Flavobacteriaceae bacterium]|nr:DUF2480 family protein [Flavobacteriaceae bacterium]